MSRLTYQTPHSRVIGPVEARTNLKANAAGTWPAIASEFGGQVWPRLRPSFRLMATDTIFTIGSCFARNVEDHLARLGCVVPMLDFHLPPEEWHGPANGALNKFSPPAFRQSLEWTAAIHDRDGKVGWEDCAPLAWDCGGGRYVDLELLAQTPISRERFVERRQHVFDITRTAFTADCVMMTPGLVETWRHVESGFYIHGFRGRHMAAASKQFQCEVLGYPQCAAELLAAIDIIRARNPAVKVLVTTSPVPLAATFTADDIRVANTYSKSVLRAVCGAISFERPLVDYFPSYESATLSNPAEVWIEDRIHVQQGFVGRIVGHLIDGYFDGVDQAARLLQRATTALGEGQHTEAAEHAAAALALAPDHDDVRKALVDALLGLRRGDEAREVIAPLLGRTPADAGILSRFSQILYLQEEYELSFEAAFQGCALPDATGSQFSWAIKHLISRDRLDEAESLARTLIERFPQASRAYQPLINLLVRQEREEDAIVILRRAVKLPLPRPEDIALLARLDPEGAAPE